MFTPEEFAKTYIEGMQAKEASEELIELVRQIAPSLVLDRLKLQDALRKIDSANAMQIAEETYLYAVIETTMRCMKDKDPFFSKLEEEMKNVPRP